MKNFLEKIYEDFTSEEENWCHLKNSQFISNGLPNHYKEYDKKYIQQFYLLKYAPLYIVEYMEIYERFLKDYDKKTLKVLSVGIGSGLDYYALSNVLKNRKDIELEYLGIDLVDWDYRSGKINFEQLDLKDISTNKNVMNFIKDGVDVIIFPKSIIEIPTYVKEHSGREKQNDAFTVLCNMIVQNNVNDVWFLNSYIKQKKAVYGMDKFAKIVEKLKSEGYIIVKGVDARHYYKSPDRSLLNYPLDYENTWKKDLHNYCHRKCGNVQAEKCNLAQSPMLGRGNIAFSITNFKKAV